MNLKLNFFSMMLAIILLSVCDASAEKYQLIPAPAYQIQTGSSLSLENGVKIISNDKRLDSVVDLFADKISEEDLRLEESGIPIHFVLYKNYQENDESYSVKIEKEAIYISANSEKGILYGAVSILQLMHNSTQISTGEIMDEPRFSYRGFMLDESRHFFGMEKVKQLLDVMMYLKLNHFAWHLTDEPAWRLAIRSYPQLTTIGARGSHSNADAPARFYTQKEIKEIVAYAAKRGITVIPEIDMPGHATAANRAYPEYSGGGSKKHPDFTFNPGKQETYTYLTNILAEVAGLFPASVIHLGGDEVHYGNEEWQKLEEVQTLMKDKNLADLKEVESYFVRRMADSIQGLGKVVGAWDETVDGDLDASNTLIYWWRHNLPEQLERSLAEGFPTVLCPRRPLYFDFVQDSTDKVGRRWNGYNPYEDVYHFPDSLAQFNAQQSDLIRGVQANLWTETVQSAERFDYMVYTRLAAMAESAWTSPETKDITSFNLRLKELFNYYDRLSIYYYNPFYKQKEPVK
ncbi:beta-N-acetylhexosaminidase [Draconibacterium mangrovi]|uniref:beta-N-acetylhexosaminidase n=1 Tax=Draconibacterium mangrovi TaxID=2697469 RepID=UPI0013D8BD66|nr:beta-N-acetylhexosaminidase [Draconibacterium mangrovi]